MRLYAGVTAGPIVDTVMMSSTPGGMWFSSFLFSSVVGKMCEELHTAGTILTVPPGHDYEEKRENRPGIGQYHDRLYLVTEDSRDDIRQAKEDLAQKIRTAKEQMIAAVADDLGKALGSKDAAAQPGPEEIKAFLRRYFRIHYVVLSADEVEEKGIAKSLADALDALELMDFPATASEEESGENLLLRITSGEENRSNRYISKYPPLVEAAKNAAPFPLAEAQKDGNIRVHDLTYIASHGRVSSEDVELNGEKLKKDERYFAIVQCDGDNMGKLLANYEQKEDSTKEDKLRAEEKHIRRISDFCMTHTAQSAQLVHRYGGVVIYAGGEDLLFLAPLFKKKEKGSPESTASEKNQDDFPVNVWELCAKLDENFRKTISDKGFKQHGNDPLPTLSFGVSVNYIKFPLYEAFSDAYDLMEVKAKGLGKKHNMAVKLHKHSGQTAGFIASLASDAMKEFLANVRSYRDESNEVQTDTDRVVHSVLYHMENFRSLFEEAMKDGDEGMLETLMENAFDNAGQIHSEISDAERSKNVASRYTALARAIARDYREKTKEDDEDTLVLGMSEGGKTPGYPRLHALTSMLRVAKLTVEGGDLGK